jgi:hypothetical protein
LRRRIKKNVNDGKFEPSWIRIGELNVGDYLVIPCPGIANKPSCTIDLVSILQHVPNLKFDESHVWVYFKDKTKATTCKRYIDLTAQLAWAVGYYLAEGHTGKRNGYCRYAEWTSHVNEYDLREDLVSILTSSFDMQPKVNQRNRDCGSSCSVRASGLVAEFFNYFAPGVHDTKYLKEGEKLITSQEHAEAFLAGVYCGDGFIIKGKYTI